MKKPMGFIELGEYYGYPPCCTAEFLEFMFQHMKGLRPVRGNRKLHGTGYIPCNHCNKLSEATLLANIAANRKCLVTFPNDEDEEVA